MVSDDPNFESKAADIIGLYLHPPANAAVFRSLADLRLKLMRYIRHDNKTATPIKWTYSDTQKRIKP